MDSSPLIVEIFKAPLTSLTIGICSAIWIFIVTHHISYEEVGLSYEKFLLQGEYWRMFSSSFSHVSPIHLLFNMSSLWSCRWIEVHFGLNFYLKYSFLLILGSVIVELALYHVFIFYFHRESYIHSISLGYSGVIFGWMTVLSQFTVGNDFSIFGLPIPLNLAPFGSLIFTSIIIPRASFIGHFSGILIGYLISFSEYFQIHWFDEYLFFNALLWCMIVVVLSVKLTTRIPLRFIIFETELPIRRTSVENS